jgi:IclR family acetate operon transcriptional repressor
METNENKNQRRGEASYYTRAVSRALRILGAFTVQNFQLSVAELHEELQIPKSTLVRLLQCMADEGFIEQDSETGEYRLGIRTFEIGSIYQRTHMMNVGALARPAMERLSAKYNVSANLAILDGDEIVYVENVEPVGSPMRLAYSVGDRFGVHHTALGKAMVAFLPEEEREALLQDAKLRALTPRTITTIPDLRKELTSVREAGYAVDDEESLPGLRCVGAPIWNSEGIVAGLSASGSTLSVSRERVAEIAEAVMETARGISAQLGGRSLNWLAD